MSRKACGDRLSDEITISELAKLMQVSVHQIRYFEEKGILNPTYIADNQYRMYGIDEIYRLAHILLLRKMGLSVQVIKECLSDLSSNQMAQLFHQALSDTDAAIAKLLDTKFFITRLLSEQDHIRYEDKEICTIVSRQAMHLSLWFHMKEPANLNAKLLAQQQGQIPNLFEADIHYVYDESGGVGVYTQNDEDSDLLLTAGSYLSRHLLVKNEIELDQYIHQFYDFAKHHGYEDDEPLIIVEKSYLSLFTPDQIHYELLLKVNDKIED